MKRSLLWAFVLFATGAGAGTAGAQPALPAGPAGITRPAFSPYLNLVRPGAPAVLNYYGLVRPEVQARQSIQNLQGAVQANQQAIGDIQGGPTDLPVTGHQAGFLTQNSYFLTTGSGRMSAYGGAGVRTPAGGLGGSGGIGAGGGGGLGGGASRTPAPRR